MSERPEMPEPTEADLRLDIVSEYRDYLGQWKDYDTTTEAVLMRRCHAAESANRKLREELAEWKERAENYHAAQTADAVVSDQRREEVQRLVESRADVIKSWQQVEEQLRAEVASLRASLAEAAEVMRDVSGKTLTGLGMPARCWCRTSMCNDEPQCRRAAAWLAGREGRAAG